MAAVIRVRLDAAKHFEMATQLAQEADVRISGVRVGKVKTREPNESSGLTDTVL